jgi:hypothetical protein
MRRFCRTCEQWADRCVCEAEDEDIAIVPNGCSCNPGYWASSRIPKICDDYIDNGGECRSCFHSESCHKGHP